MDEDLRFPSDPVLKKEREFISRVVTDFIASTRARNYDRYLPLRTPGAVAPDLKKHILSLRGEPIPSQAMVSIGGPGLFIVTDGGSEIFLRPLESGVHLSIRLLPHPSIGSPLRAFSGLVPWEEKNQVRDLSSHQILSRRKRRAKLVENAATLPPSVLIHTASHPVEVLADSLRLKLTFDISADALTPAVQITSDGLYRYVPGLHPLTPEDASCPDPVRNRVWKTAFRALAGRLHRALPFSGQSPS